MAASAVLAFDAGSDVAWQVLENEINCADAQRRGIALRAIDGHWSTSEKARSLVLGRLDDTDISLRILACEIAIEHRGVDAIILRTLMAAIREPGPYTRPAMQLLGELGSAATPALPYLREKIYGPDSLDGWVARVATGLIHRALAAEADRSPGKK